MCFFKTPRVVVQAPEPTAAAEPAPAPAVTQPAPPPAAPVFGSYAGSEAGSSQSVNPVMANTYDPTNPESGIQEEKGAARKRAAGTQQLRIDLDPAAQSMGKAQGTGLQISK